MTIDRRTGVNNRRAKGRVPFVAGVVASTVGGDRWLGLAQDIGPQGIQLLLPMGTGVPVAKLEFALPDGPVSVEVREVACRRDGRYWRSSMSWGEVSPELGARLETYLGNFV